MPFVQAKCESCGAILTVDSNLKAAICTYCGSAYVVQDSINYYNSFTKVEHMHADVVNVSDESNSEGRLKAAEAYMKIRKYDNAELEYRKVTELTPQNYKGWLGLIESRTNNYSKRNKSAGELKILDDYARSVKAFAPDNTSRELLANYEEYKKIQIKKNNEEIGIFNNAISEQTATWGQLDVQENELASKLLENKGIVNDLADKAEKYKKNNHENAEICWLLFLLPLGPITCLLNIIVGLILILAAGIPCFLLIFGTTQSKNRKKEIDRLMAEQYNITAEIYGVQSKKNALYSSIQANKQELAKYK